MTHSIDIRVYYEDVDLGGVVYYANYLRYFERGRSDALRALGVDQTAMRAADLVFVVRRITVDYRAPARFDDIVTVQTEITAVRGASLEMTQTVSKDGRPLVTASVQAACMTLEGRPARLPDHIRTAILSGTTG